MNNLNAAQVLRIQFECSCDYEPTLRMIYKRVKDFALDLCDKNSVNDPMIEGILASDLCIFLEDENETQES